jgi:hypothetical protein
MTQQTPANPSTTLPVCAHPVGALAIATTNPTEPERESHDSTRFSRGN